MLCIGNLGGYHTRNVMRMLRAGASPPDDVWKVLMPKSVKNIAFALLIMLLFGTTFGWIGGL
jgi:hypothetical protein